MPRVGEELADTKKEFEARDAEIRVPCEHHGDMERQVCRNTEEIGHLRSSLVAVKAPEDLKMSLGSEDSEGFDRFLKRFGMRLKIKKACAPSVTNLFTDEKGMPARLEDEYHLL